MYIVHVILTRTFSIRLARKFVPFFRVEWNTIYILQN